MSKKLEETIRLLESDCRTLESAAAEAYALCLNHEGYISRLEAEVVALKAELKSSKEIQSAEKKILIEEIERNTKLRAALLNFPEIIWRGN